MTIQIIGSRNPRIEVRTSLDGIVMGPEEIAEQERLEEERARTKDSEVQVGEKDQSLQPKEPPIKEQGKIYVPVLDLYVSENRILRGKDWNQQTEALHSGNKRMPTIPEFQGFVNYLRSPEGKKAVPNFQAILDEIYQVGGNWRSENLDAFFVKKQDGMYVAYHRFDKKGKIIKIEEKLEDYYNKDELPGIDLDIWLNDSTKQGLPKPNCQKGGLWYWFPRDNRVARFVVGSGGAGFGCGRNPAGSISWLGVRYVEPRTK